MLVRAVCSGEFSPMNVGQPALWLEADRRITLDGSNNVSAAADQGGNGRHTTQTDAAHRFDYITNAKNGLPVLRGNRDAGLNFVTPYSPGNAVTIFLVGKGGNTNQFVLGFNPDSIAPGVWLANGEPVIRVNAINYGLGTTFVDTWAILRFHFNTVGPQLAMSANNGTRVIHTPGAFSAPTWQNLFWGLNNYLYSWLGDVAVLLVYPKITSTQEDTYLFRGFGQKYGIAVAA